MGGSAAAKSVPLRGQHSSRHHRMGLLDSRVVISIAACVAAIMGASAQQNYGNVDGYTCSGSQRSCSTYVLYKTQSAKETVSTVATLFNVTASSVAKASGMNGTSNALNAQQALYVPVACNCVNVTTQADVTRTIISGDTFYGIANTIYEGLLTYQAIEILNPRATPTTLFVGQKIKIPVFCACPTAAQVRNGTKFILTYPLSQPDTLNAVAYYFGVSVPDLMIANNVTETSALQANTSFLVPLASLPALSSIQFLTNASTSSPAPVASSPSSSTSSNSTSQTSGGKGSNKALYIGVAVGAAGLLVAAVLAVLLLVHCCRKSKSGQYRKERFQPYAQDVEGGNKVAGESQRTGLQQGLLAGMPDMVGSDKPVLFTYEELEKATNNFSAANRIQGSVFFGTLKGMAVAIKQMKGDMTQELKILCQVHHSNVVKLVGMCVSTSEHLYLVYEFAENGSLRDCLSNQSSVTHTKFSHSVAYLPWTARVQIALDVASGLEYIHNYTNPSFVHKDVKSSNILLDGNFRAKVANFGMAKTAASPGGQLTRHIAGTQGYMSPEYLEHGLVTTKADVFAYGVVLLEILSGLEAIVIPAEDETAGKERALSDMIVSVLDGENQMEKLQEWMDPLLRNAYPLDTACSVASLAKTCVDTDPGLRPSMKEITFALSKMLVASREWESSEQFARNISDVSVEAR